MLVPTLLDYQKQLEEHFADFIGLLDKSRVCLLSEIMQGQDVGIHWLDTELFRHRLENAYRFFIEKASAPQNVPPLVFIQPTAPEEDHSAHIARIQQNPENLWLRNSADPGEFYLHTHTNFFGVLTEGPLGKHIAPFHTFACYSEDMSEEKLQLPEKTKSGAIVGYRVPNYSEILKVKPRIATEYFARIVVHDISHQLTPFVYTKESEGVHNIVSIYAATSWQHEQREVLDTVCDPWERLVLAECANPYFAIEAPSYISACTALPLNPTQLRFLWKMKRWYASPAHRKNLEGVWRLTAKEIGDPRIGKEALEEKIITMREDGFRIYSENS